MSVLSWVLNCVICFSLALSACLAQSPFGFVEIASSAHANALGGNQISHAAKEGYAFMQNPALLDSADRGQLSVTYSPYFTGHFTTASCMLPGRRAFTAGIFVQALNFGDFTETDNLGHVTGSFGVGNYQAGAGVAMKSGHITFGGNVRFMNSFIAGYWASALAFDWGSTLYIPEKDLSFSLVARNVGFSLGQSPFTENIIPFNLLSGVSFKPRFMPARVHITAEHLSEWEADRTGVELKSVSDRIFSHIAAGADLLIHPALSFTVSNHFGRSLGSGKSIFSAYGLGVNLHLKTFRLSVSHAANPRLRNQTFFTAAFML